ncbi:MAG: glycosyltransferase [Planctomycetota bacterium]
MQREPTTTAIIPTLNGEKRVPDVLRAIGHQPQAALQDLRVIVVDNGSPPSSLRAIEAADETKALRDAGVPVEFISEPRSGASFARMRGAESTDADYLVFLDDDNVPEPDFFAVGPRAFAEFPEVGMLVSRIHASWEEPPPSAVYKRRALLAINEALGEQSITWSGDSIAPTLTAGMWVRREPFLSAVRSSRWGNLLPDRCGGSLMCGGDIEFGIRIARSGWKIRYEPDLRLQHIIPIGRTGMAYMARLIYSIARSEQTLLDRYPLTRGLGGRSRRVAANVAKLTLAPLAGLVRCDLAESVFVAAGSLGVLAGPYRLEEGAQNGG